ncbi:hypothetical protein F2P56_020072 [Juglans regia]|uniref:Uncharacterized protein n=1 Tax=Juglans regia TaxID=51240 RepID=A0A833TI02_JUGRE|nr:hypothetical protein F2P56_020072 [Juglans regia]
MKDKEGRTPVHIAAHRANKQLMKMIIDRCPDCCELVDNRGWNALHFAVEGNWPDSVVGVILENSSFSNLLNEKDDEGNTPLHHQYSRCFEKAKKNLMDHPRVDKMAFNKNNHNAYQVTLTSAKLSAIEVTSQSIFSLSSHQNGTLIISYTFIGKCKSRKVHAFHLFLLVLKLRYRISTLFSG